MNCVQCTFYTIYQNELYYPSHGSLFYSCIKTSILEGVKKYSITLLLSNITLKEKTISDWDNTLLK